MHLLREEVARANTSFSGGSSLRFLTAIGGLLRGIFGYSPRISRPPTTAPSLPRTSPGTPTTEALWPGSLSLAHPLSSIQVTNPMCISWAGPPAHRRDAFSTSPCWITKRNRRDSGVPHSAPPTPASADPGRSAHLRLHQAKSPFLCPVACAPLAGPRAPCSFLRLGDAPTSLF